MWVCVWRSVVIWVTSLDNIVIVIIFLHSDFLFFIFRLNKQLIRNVHFLITCHCLYIFSFQATNWAVYKMPWREKQHKHCEREHALIFAIVYWFAFAFHFTDFVVFFSARSAFSKLKCFPSPIVYKKIHLSSLPSLRFGKNPSAYFKENEWWKWHGATSRAWWTTNE